MYRFTFWCEGLNREESITAETEKQAYKALWTSFTNEEQDCVSSMECVAQEYVDPRR
jgi:hypothetical protein